MTRIQTLVTLAALAHLAGPASAHAPHDDAKVLAISSNFRQDGTLFAVVQLSDMEVFARSIDAGLTWEMTGHAFAQENARAIDFSPAYAWDRTAFAATLGAGVWRTNDAGDSWQPAWSGGPDPAVFELAVSPAYGWDRTVVAATASGPAVTTDRGQTWALSASGYTELAAEVVAYAPGGGTVFAGRRTLHRSDDGGATWTALATFTDAMTSIAVSPAFGIDAGVAVSFGASGNGAEFSTDGGVSFAPMTTGLSDLELNEVALAVDGTVFASARTDGVFRADALGGTWTLFQEGFEELGVLTQDHFRDLAISPRFDLDGSVFVAAYEGIFGSNDRGENWLQSDVYSLRGHRRVRFSPDFANDRTMYGAIYGGSLAAYAVDGNTPVASVCPPTDVQQGTWTSIGNGLKPIYGGALTLSPTFTVDRTMFYAYTGVYRSNDAGTTWARVQLPTQQVIRTVAMSPGYPADGTWAVGMEAGSGNGGLWMTQDDGANWTQLTSGLPVPLSAHTLAFSPAFAADRTMYVTLRAGTIVGGVGGQADDSLYISRDGGATWQQPPPLTSGLPQFRGLRSLAVTPGLSDTRVFVGTARFGLYRSADRGMTFTAVNGGLPNGGLVNAEALAVSPNYQVDQTLFLATRGHGVWRSEDAGDSWSFAGAGLPPHAPWDIAVSPDYRNDLTVVLSTVTGTWATEDDGASWRELPGYLRADDIHPTITHEGSWSFAPDATSLAQLIQQSAVTGDATEHLFHGEAVSWVAPRDPSYGIAEVFVDGVSSSFVDLYSATPVGSATVFGRSFGANGWHTIRVEVTGVSNPASSGVTIATDGFAVESLSVGPYRPYGFGSAGGGGIVPQLRAGGCPAGGAAVTVQVTQAPGGAMGLLLVGARRYAMPTDAGVIWTDLPYNWYPHVTSGAPGVPGMGTFTLPLATPSDPSCIGKSFYLQSGYLDPFVVTGAAMTAGLEVVLQAP